MRITFNPDKEKVEEITKALRNNDGYCPCKLVKNEDTKCMCKEFKYSDEPGLCHCGLYLRIDDSL